MLFTRPALFAASVGVLLALPTAASAQTPALRPGYYPLGPAVPPGLAGEWAAIRAGASAAVCVQQVRFQTPTAGLVTLYDGPGRPVELAAPAQAGLIVGPVYRFRLSQMPEYPGVELYPSIELVDRLHPPPGRAAEFPVPVAFTPDELRQAIDGRMITKVVYLEQPTLAALDPVQRDRSLAPHVVPMSQNPLKTADIFGRPIAILRLGGRAPDLNNPEPGFYGGGAPIQVELLDPAPETAEPSDPQPPVEQRLAPPPGPRRRMR